MLSQVSKLGNSQGIRLPKKILQSAQINHDDEVEIKVMNNMLIITPTSQKTLEWYLDGYENDPDIYDWGSTDEPVGRELI